MLQMQKEMTREKEIIETWATQTEEIDHYSAEVQTVIVKEEKDQANVEMLKKTEAKIAEMQALVKSFDAKMEADEAKRMESEIAMKLLEDQTHNLFHSAEVNSNRISAL